MIHVGDERRAAAHSAVTVEAWQPQGDPEPDPIHVVIFDEERLFAEALALVLLRDGIQVDAIAVSEAEIMGAIREAVPDVVIFGVDSPNQAELRGARAVLDANPGVRVLILAATMSRTHVKRVLRSGLHGCISKDASVARVVRTLRTIATEVTARRVDPAAGYRHPSRTPSHPSLTPRELEVLELIAVGASGREIARRLGISENTVRTHSQNILAKLDVHSRLEAATLAIRTGLVQLWVSDQVDDVAG
jgi:two-component system nitrate/nitrite response regulator NarL